MNPMPARIATSWLNKVPEVTLSFWLVKMMSTTVGETAADFLADDLHSGLIGTSAVTGALLALALWAQLRARRYVPWRYWTVVVLTSIFGTLITDNLTDRMGVPLAVSTGVFGVLLVAVFADWHDREGTLSIDAIDTRPRELFYWLAILVTFALGTAAGDWVAEGLALGDARSVLLFGTMIALVALARYAFGANRVAAFWVAYVLTRPLGAACGDWLTQPVANGGLGMGSTVTSIVFVAGIIALVACMTGRQRSVGKPRANR